MSESPASPAPAPSTRRRGLRIGVISVAVALGLVLLAAAIYAIVLDRSITRNINREDTLPSGGASSARPTVNTTGALNYLLLGSDSRNPQDAGEGRADSIMVVHLNRARDQAYIISFPRDMWVEIPGHGMNKINAAFPLGGAGLTVQTLEALTDVRIDHVVQIDFEGFIQLTEELGGVQVTNETAFTSHGHSYPKGKITISGEKALWFVRERYSLPRGDLDRAENQRKVIQAIVRKGLSPDVVADPVRFTGFIGGLAKHLTVDATLTDAEIRATALSLRLTANNIKLMQAPLTGLGTINGQSVDLVDEAKMAELSTAMRDDTVAEYLKKYPNG